MQNAFCQMCEDRRSELQKWAIILYCFRSRQSLVKTPIHAKVTKNVKKEYVCISVNVHGMQFDAVRHSFCHKWQRSLGPNPQTRQNAVCTYTESLVFMLKKTATSLRITAIKNVHGSERTVAALRHVLQKPFQKQAIRFWFLE